MDSSAVCALWRINDSSRNVKIYQLWRRVQRANCRCRSQQNKFYRCRSFHAIAIFVVASCDFFHHCDSCALSIHCGLSPASASVHMHFLLFRLYACVSNAIFQLPTMDANTVTSTQLIRSLDSISFYCSRGPRFTLPHGLLCGSLEMPRTLAQCRCIPMAKSS